MKSSSKSTGLLIEIIISTVFFAIICAAVLQLFLYAQQVEQYSRDKAGAISVAQSIGDMFRSREDFDTLLNERFGQALEKEGADSYIVRLDQSMQPAARENGPCFVSISLTAYPSTQAGTTRRALIQVNKAEDVLFDLAVDVYKPEGVS